jgi:hypothetical protein
MQGATMNPVPLFLRLAPLAMLLAGAAHGAGVQDGPDRVGEATMVIGGARVTSTDGVARVVDRGTTIRVGDRIETGVGGHVHLRFVDGGRLSVRPSSRLQVENYSHSVDQPALNAIKFRLDEGVVRSITGAWGEAARDRFRLNTPVAAIGVKGTDFVVKADANNTLASVYTGAIMLTPLASGCQASLGPCQNGSEKLLSEDMKGQMLTLSRLQAVPQLVPAVDLLAQRVPQPSAEASPKPDTALKANGNRSDIAAENSMVSESRAAGVVASQSATAALQVPTQAPQVQRPPEVNQLMWARLAAVAADGDTISRSFAQAAENNRQGTVGNGAYSLFREAPGAAPAVLASADTSANFRLAGAAAQLVWSDRGRSVSEAARVDKGTLSVDFARSTYATQLNVSNARMGTESVASSGQIKPNGLLQSQSGNAFVAGALSLDGKEAGYVFEKSLAAGQLLGITQWGR